MEATTLQAKKVLVTGGGRGIGRAVAIAFAQQGADVAVCARTTSEIEQVAQECRRTGVSALACPLDVSERGSCVRAVERCEAEMGPVDVLVNNAGIATSQKFLDVDEATWEETLRINVTGAFYITQAILPGMLARRSGSVIAISSTAGKVGEAYIAPYAASKHALTGLIRSLAAEYAPSGVTFNSVCPAYVDTSMAERAVDTIVKRTGRSRQDALNALLTPQGRLVKPEEVAAVCVFLASGSGRSINGQAIVIDGGEVQT